MKKKKELHNAAWTCYVLTLLYICVRGAVKQGHRDEQGKPVKSVTIVLSAWHGTKLNLADSRDEYLYQNTPKGNIVNLPTADVYRYFSFRKPFVVLVLEHP